MELESLSGSTGGGYILSSMESWSQFAYAVDTCTKTYGHTNDHERSVFNIIMKHKSESTIANGQKTKKIQNEAYICHLQRFGMSKNERPKIFFQNKLHS